MRGLIEKFGGQAALADHRAECADRDVFTRVRDDDSVPIRIPEVGMAAALGYESKAVVGEDGDEFGRWDSFRHGLKIRSSDGKFSDGDFSDFREGGRFREIFEIEFEGFLEICECFLLSVAEAGHVVAEALGDVVGIFAVEGVMDASHRLKNREKAANGKEMGG